mmetsp:Transcript_1183/g.2565  ORF Transcript_1183/g.2565 Transcript_1183/m.2565 type:complete len:98 (+) Transcript_1183:469-762(+)
MKTCNSSCGLLHGIRRSSKLRYIGKALTVIPYFDLRLPKALFEHTKPLILCFGLLLHFLVLIVQSIVIQPNHLAAIDIQSQSRASNLCPLLQSSPSL